MKVTSQPIVSIITPFLNVENYIRESIESVIAQTYNNWELMLIDDGCSDKSTSIAKEYAAKFPDKIKYLEHENHQNKGASASRNLGFLKSKGELIAFLDADDIYLPHKLKDQVPLLLENPTAGMLYASTEYWYSWTGLPEDANKDWIWKEFGFTPNQLIEPPKLLNLYLGNGGTVPCMGSILVRRKAIEEIGGWEDAFKFIYTDQVFHAKMTLKWPIFIADGCWDKYRQHPNSSCSIVEKTGQAQKSRQNYLVWLEKYLNEQGVQKNTELWNAFERAIWPFRYPTLNKIKEIEKKILYKGKRLMEVLTSK